MPALRLPEGHRLYYLDENPMGSRAVVLLHGLGSNGSAWGFQIPTLAAAGLRVIAPDLRGFGRSGYPGGRLTIAALTADISSLVDAIGKPIALAGISLGGAVALQLALNQPQALTHLVLINTFARLRPRSLSVWAYYALRAALVFTLGIPAQARRVSRRIFPLPGQEHLRTILYQQILEANPHAYRLSMIALARFDVLSRIHEVRMPTLVLTGAQDSTVPPEDQQVLVDRIPDCRHIMIEEAGHAAIADQPGIVNQALLEFLAGPS